MNNETVSGVENAKKSYKINDITLFYRLVKPSPAEKRILVSVLEDANVNLDKVAILEGAKNINGILDIPEKIDGCVTAFVGKKAFLSESSIRTVKIPATILSLGEWSFAQCTHLREVYMEGNPELGKGVFIGCKDLRHICFDRSEKNNLSAILATLASKLPAEYLLFDKSRGSKDWYLNYDKKLRSYLKEEDEEGYTDLVLCGEEDIQRSLPEYITDKRMDKSELCFIRLLHNEGLSEKNRERYIRYILKYNKGCEDDAAWQALNNYFAEDIRYYKLFSEIGGITEENLDNLLSDMGDKNAEAKAFFIRYKTDNFGGGDAFDMFDL